MSKRRTRDRAALAAQIQRLIDRWPGAADKQRYMGVSGHIALKVWAVTAAHELQRDLAAGEIGLVDVVAACDALTSAERIYLPSIAEILEAARGSSRDAGEIGRGCGDG